MYTYYTSQCIIEYVRKINIMYYLVRIFEINSDSMKEYEFTNIKSALKCFQNELIAQLVRIINDEDEYLGENKMLNYEQMTNKELKEIAKEKKVKNWWNLTKEDIIIELKNSKFLNRTWSQQRKEDK